MNSACPFRTLTRIRENPHAIIFRKAGLEFEKIPQRIVSTTGAARASEFWPPGVA